MKQWNTCHLTYIRKYLVIAIFCCLYRHRLSPTHLTTTQESSPFLLPPQHEPDLVPPRKFSFHIFWRMGPDKQLPSSILVTKQQFPSRIQVVCWEAAILLLRSCKNDTGKVLQLYWDGAVKLPNSMMPNCCWDRAGLIFKQYFSSALKRSCILYVYYTGPF